MFLNEVLNGGDAPALEESASDQPTPRPRRWGDLSPQQKKIVLVAVVLNAIIASFTWRDLRRRPRELVRGPKFFWRVWSSMNTTGSVAYWLVGRRRRPTTAVIVS